MGVGREEPSTMTPKEGPNLLSIGFRQIQQGQFGATVESKIPLPMRRRNQLQARPDLEKKHQPIGLTLIAILADEAGQMEVGRPERYPRLFQSLTAGAGVG
jgi:hypothetical protein